MYTCTSGPRKAETSTARSSATTRSPRTSAIPRRVTSRPGGVQLRPRRTPRPGGAGGPRAQDPPGAGADGGVAAPDATARDRPIEIEASFELGVVHVVEQFWARLGIGQAIQSRLASDERRAPHEAALLAMAAPRRAWPGCARTPPARSRRVARRGRPGPGRAGRRRDPWPRAATPDRASADGRPALSHHRLVRMR